MTGTASEELRGQLKAAHEYLCRAEPMVATVRADRPDQQDEARHELAVALEAISRAVAVLGLPAGATFDPGAGRHPGRPLQAQPGHLWTSAGYTLPTGPALLYVHQEGAVSQLDGDRFDVAAMSKREAVLAAGLVALADDVLAGPDEGP